MLQEWKLFMAEVWRSGQLQNILISRVFHWIICINRSLSKAQIGLLGVSDIILTPDFHNHDFHAH